MKRRVLFAAVVLAVTAFIPGPLAAQTPATAKPAATPPAVTAAELSVTVTYKGKGTVDATRDIHVFVFDHANVGPTSEPLGMQLITKSGGTATFKGLPAGSDIYVVAVYDDKGTYDGRSGPPAPGTPFTMYSTTEKKVPAAVKAGAKVKMTLDDSQIWK